MSSLSNQSSSIMTNQDSAWLREHTFHFHLKLPFSGWSRLAQGRMALTEPEQVEQARADQNCLAGGGPCSRAVSPHSHFRAMRCCFITELYHYRAVPWLCCITTELFALNKVSFFTTPQTGDSCWCGTGADYLLTVQKLMPIFHNSQDMETKCP